jgi:formylmethanofuran dehydrogenase subunit E
MHVDYMKTLLAMVLLSVPVLAADQFLAVAVAKAACGPDSIKFNVTSGGQQPVAPADPGKALIYVVNEQGAPTVRVGLDGAWVGANRDASYLFFSVQTGEHHLCTDWQTPLRAHVKPALANLTAEPDQTYYFRTRIMEGPGFYTLEFDRVNSDEGKLLVATSPLSGYREKK